MITIHVGAYNITELQSRFRQILHFIFSWKISIWEMPPCKVAKAKLCVSIYWGDPYATDVDPCCDTTKNEVPPCRLKSRKPCNKKAQEMLSVIPEDRSKDAWIAAT